jgi:uncharacterized membrane protein YecN with MAPEG domain
VELIAIIAALALIEYLVFGLMAGMARGKYKVEAPATVGHPIFERRLRVQTNTLEQLIVFLPGLVLFGRYVSAPIGVILGAIFILGRIVYSIGYVADPAKRSVGFVLSYVPVVLLILGGLFGAAAAWF